MAIVVHTTGYGPIRRWAAAPDRYPGPYDAALHIYRKIMRAGPHFVIGQCGECVQTAPEDLAAWHIGSRGARAYRKAPRTPWWAESWPEYETPRDLAGGRLWEGWSANTMTLGIEVVPPRDNVRGPWSLACMDALDSLIWSLSDDWKIPRARGHVITHADAHPHDRTRRGRPWDPSPVAWDTFLEAFPLAS